jgi:hypothetical protein
MMLAVGCGSDEVTSDSSDEATAGGNGVAGQIGVGGGTSGSSGTSGGSNNSAGRGGSSGSQAGAPLAGSSSGGVPSLCDPATEPVVCVDDENIRGCTGDGVIETSTCQQVCEVELRFQPGACVTDAEGSGCDCGDPLNPECFTGADAFCACAGCTIDDFLLAYLACDDVNQPTVTEALLCFAGLVTEDATGAPMIDCAAAETECLPQPAMP